VFNFGGRRAEVTLVAVRERVRDQCRERERDRERERERDLKNIDNVDISNLH